MTWTIHTGDARSVLATLPEESVDCCVTSPPYFGLRLYSEELVRIDPRLTEDARLWLLGELEKRGVHAKR